MSRGLTAPELERAVVALHRLRALRRAPWELRHVRRTLSPRVRPLRATLAELTALGLLSHYDGDRWALTPVGERVLDAQDEKNWRPVTVVVMASGVVDDEVMAFLQAAEEVDGFAVLAAARARSLCPMLAAVAGWVPEWRRGDELVVPLESLQTAMAAAAMELADARPEWVEEREQVGRRAEAYSLRRERERDGVAAVLYVSRDVGDHYGYDLENRAGAPTRRIECKGSRSKELNFILTAHERRRAQEHSEAYEIHFWGGIDLTRRPADEYEALVAAGYPVVIADPERSLVDGRLVAVCAAWEIREAGP